MLVGLGTRANLDGDMTRRGRLHVVCGWSPIHTDESWCLMKGQRQLSPALHLASMRGERAIP